MTDTITPDEAATLVNSLRERLIKQEGDPPTPEEISAGLAAMQIIARTPAAAAISQKKKEAAKRPLTLEDLPDL